MKYKDFETIISEKRMRKYLAACDQDKRRAMLLYRLNLRLSQEIFTVISCFEVALRNGNYSPSKLLAEMEFGVWKYTFSTIEYRLTGRVALRAFPQKPRSTPNRNIDHTFIFAELDYINNLRNRIAHHEPIVFDSAGQINTFYAQSRYEKMLKLFAWMGIDSKSMLYGLDHVVQVCKEIHRVQTH